MRPDETPLGRVALPEGDAARAAIGRSWDENAAAWTSAVRGARIPSRRLGTDAAVVRACRRALDGMPAPRALDVGCGEGWLAHELARHGARVLGIDGSADLSRAAGQLSGSPAEFRLCSYDQLRDDPAQAAGPFDLIVCNFALLDDRARETLETLRMRLARGGHIVVQTVHPWAAMGEGEVRYEQGWRLETYASFDERFPSSMPWFFRTLGGWLDDIAGAGLRIARLEEPLHPETGRPLSLVFTLTSG